MVRHIGVNRFLSQQAKLRLPRRTFDLFHAEREDSKTLAIVVAVAAWIPTALSSALNGSHALRAFLLDFAAQSRLLVVIPLLIIAEPWMIERWTRIASHFLKTDLISKEDIPPFQEAFAVLNRGRHLVRAQVVALGIVYGLVIAAIPSVREGEFPPWCAGTQVMNRLSVPGAFYVLVSLPFLLYLVVRWLWNLALWTAFLNKVSRLHLRLIPSHPDQMAGLGFLESSVRGYLPFAFAIGTIVAGGVTNKVVHARENILSFKSTAIFVVAVVVLVCAGPLCTFFNVLVRAKNRGTFLYGGLAAALGHEFEAKWLDPHLTANPGMLEMPDFSAAIDLFSVAGNVRAMRYVPFGVQSIARIVVATLVPAIPVALFTIPFNVLLNEIIKLVL